MSQNKNQVANQNIPPIIKQGALQQNDKNYFSCGYKPTQIDLGRFIYYVPYNLQGKKHSDIAFMRKTTKNRTRKYKQFEEQAAMECQNQIGSRSRSRQKKKFRDLNQINENSYQETKIITKEQAFKKTQICPLFQRGRCTKGDECTYAHSIKQLRSLPDLRKTKLCIGFKEGNCHRTSDKCKYAHGEQQLKKVPKIIDRSQKSNGSPNYESTPRDSYIGLNNKFEERNPHYYPYYQNPNYFYPGSEMKSTPCNYSHYAPYSPYLNYSLYQYRQLQPTNYYAAQPYMIPLTSPAYSNAISQGSSPQYIQKN